MVDNELEELVSIFSTRAILRSLIPGCTIDIGALSLDDAYTVQEQVIERRVAKGERVVGYKVGCTSRDIRRQFGLKDPMAGRLMAPFVYTGETVLNWHDYIQCAVEPEFVFGIRCNVTSQLTDEESLLDSIEWMAPGIEIHNHKFWFGQASSQELIASNGIHAALVVGEHRVPPRSFNTTREGVGLFRNGALEASGIGAEIMGGPLKSLCWLINHLAQRGKCLQAGQLVIPGSPVNLVSVQPNDRITADFTCLGKVEVQFSESS